MLWTQAARPYLARPSKSLWSTTSDTRTAETDATGGYTISTVTPGTYRVEINKEGFRSFVATDILVNQNNVVRVDAQLQVGSLAERVEVPTTPVAELQTERADIHAEIATGALIDLPQPNRTYLGLLEVVPGTTPPPGSSVAEPTTRSRVRY